MAGGWHGTVWYGDGMVVPIEVLVYCTVPSVFMIPALFSP